MIEVIVTPLVLGVMAWHQTNKYLDLQKMKLEHELKINTDESGLEQIKLQQEQLVNHIKDLNTELDAFKMKVAMRGI